MYAVHSSTLVFLAFSNLFGLMAQTPALKETADEQLLAKKAAEAMHILASAAIGKTELVKGKPFAAEATIETVQTLADGRQVRRTNLTRYFRDGQGRTRREQTIESFGLSVPAAPLQMVVISDPVANIDYILDPVRKTIRKFPRLRIDSGQEDQVTGVREAAGKAGKDGEKRDLGTRVIEGLECTGTVRSGKGETWYSPAIEAVVRSSTADPRLGQSTYALHRVRQAEQPRELFEPPPGYRLEFEGKPGIMVKRIEHP